MRAAYLDTSVVVALAFGEPAGKAVARKLARVNAVFGRAPFDVAVAPFAQESLTVEYPWSF